MDADVQSLAEALEFAGANVRVIRSAEEEARVREELGFAPLELYKTKFDANGVNGVHRLYRGEIGYVGGRVIVRRP